MKTKNSKSSSTARTTGSITPMASRRKRSASAAELLAAEGIDLAAVVHELEQLSPVNASRVVKLHDRIGAREYPLDSRRIASKLLQFEKSLKN